MADNKRHVVGLVVVDELVTFEALLLHQKGHHLQHLSSSAIVMTLARSTANSRSKVRRTAARHPSGTDLPAWVRRATERQTPLQPGRSGTQRARTRRYPGRRRIHYAVVERFDVHGTPSAS